MRWVRAIVRVVGWLLTPLVAWAASLLGAWLATLAAPGISSAMTAFTFTVCVGAAAGFGGLLLWMRVLRRSPRLRHSLHVTREGIPIADDLLAPGGDEGTATPS
ncbi:MAG TPA: hypothetical protein VLT17_00865 [Gemmatimonadales bacterium]|jgi:hypothetical protein|nr:hypothetical protein [Gemmatimonadales bacterium]